MDTPVSHASSDVFIALAGSALITALAWNLAPDPRDTPRAHAPMQQTVPAATLQYVPVPTAAPAGAKAAPQTLAPHLPTGRSYKCTVAGRVEYTDRVCAAEADAALINTSPALDGAVRLHR